LAISFTNYSIVFIIVSRYLSLDLGTMTSKSIEVGKNLSKIVCLLDIYLLYKSKVFISEVKQYPFIAYLRDSPLKYCSF